ANVATRWRNNSAAFCDLYVFTKSSTVLASTMTIIITELVQSPTKAETIAANTKINTSGFLNSTKNSANAERSTLLTISFLPYSKSLFAASALRNPFVSNAVSIGIVYHEGDVPTKKHVSHFYSILTY